ncbi:MAG: hypothetical protein HY079_00725 [Elusimicrobia bacterium]|nr:hypothetical protein [Elusimicrobiota bacterium]
MTKKAKPPVPVATPPAPNGAAPPERAPFTPYDLFLKCLERARNLLLIHSQAHGKQAKPERHLSDCHRAAIVLTIAALDAYVRALVLDRISGILLDKSFPLPPPLAARIKSLIKEDALLEAARNEDLVERVEKAFKGDFEKKTFQGIDAISEALELIGVKNIFHEIAIGKKANEDTLRRDLQLFTQRRHTIAHRGDYDLTQTPPRENPITKTEAEACIRLVALIGSGIHGYCK